MNDTTNKRILVLCVFLLLLIIAYFSNIDWLAPYKSPMLIIMIGLGIAIVAAYWKTRSL